MATFAASTDAPSGASGGVATGPPPASSDARRDLVGRDASRAHPDSSRARRAAPAADPPADVDVEQATLALRRMRAPGMSELTTCAAYKTMAARGLSGVDKDLPASAMRTAYSSMVRRNGGVLHVSSADLAPKRGVASRAAAPVSPAKTAPPRNQRYAAPVETLRRRASGWRRKLADDLVRVAVDPDAVAAVDARAHAIARAKRRAANANANANAKAKGAVDVIAAHRENMSRWTPEARKAAAAARRADRDAKGDAARARVASVRAARAAEPTKSERAAAARARERKEREEREEMEKTEDAAATAAAGFASGSGAVPPDPERSAASRARWLRAFHLVRASLNPAEIRRERAVRVIQRYWRGHRSRERLRRVIAAAAFIAARARLWLHRKRRREAAARVRAFLEEVDEGSEVVRRLHRLRRACATIQSHYRAAFRIHPDALDAFARHWEAYERFAATRRVEAEARAAGRVDNAARDAIRGGFKISRASRYVQLDPRRLIPREIKYPVIARFLRRRRAQRGRDWEEHRAALENWRANSLRDAKLELARLAVVGARGGAIPRRDGGDAAEAKRLETKPRPRRRRWLMTQEELERVHAEGARAWERDAMDRERAVDALFDIDVGVRRFKPDVRAATNARKETRAIF